MARSFTAVVAEQLTAALWAGLVDGDIGLLRIPDFLTQERRESALKRLDNGGHFVAYDPMDECGGIDPEAHRQIMGDLLAGRGPNDPAPVSRRLGITLYEHTARGTADQYFHDADGLDTQRRETFADGGDPVDELLHEISDVTGASAAIAADPRHGRCFAGVIRDVHGRSRLHTDDAREESPGFAFAETPYQLGVNIFLDMPEEGGDLTVYFRELRPEDAPFRQGYGLAPQAVAGEPCVRIAPRAGDLIVFPGRNIHQVAPCTGPGRRIMMHAHLGVHADQSVDCWS